MRKVIVIGNGGAGKSTFATKLGKVTGLPVTPLDTIYWQSDGTTLESTEFDPILRKILQQDKWIIDGNYKRTLALRTSYADTIIYLDYPRWLPLWRIFKRYFKQLLGLEKTAAGNPIRLDPSFVWWVLTFPRKKILETVRENMVTNSKLVLLQSLKQTNQFLDGIKKEAADEKSRRRLGVEH